MTYNPLLDHLEQVEEQDNSMDQELHKFRATSQACSQIYVWLPHTK